MSTPQETSNAAMAPAIDVESDGEDEQVVNLVAVTREATAKLEKDLADAKVQNDEIMQKKQEWADRRAAVKKKNRRTRRWQRHRERQMKMPRKKA